MPNYPKQEPVFTANGIPVTGWNYGTLADGLELTDKTIVPLVDAINKGSDDLDSVSSYLQGEIDELYTFSGKVEVSAGELSDRITNNTNEIDKLKAATDVIMVYGTYADFTANSASLTLTDKDVIKVLIDEHTTPVGQQVYYQYSKNANSWTDIGSLPAYYSKSEFDEWTAARFDGTKAKTALKAEDADKLVGVAGSTVTSNASHGESVYNAYYNKNVVTFGTCTNITANTAFANNAYTFSYTGYKPKADGTYLSASNADASYGITIGPKTEFVTSATAGSAAYNWITAKSATLSAGEGIKFEKAAENVLGIRTTGVLLNNTTFTAVNGQQQYPFNLTGFTLQAGAGIGFTQGAGNVLQINNTSNSYTDSDCIYIDTQNNNAITLSSIVTATDFCSSAILVTNAASAGIDIAAIGMASYASGIKYGNGAGAITADTTATVTHSGVAITGTYLSGGTQQYISRKITWFDLIGGAQYLAQNQFIIANNTVSSIVLGTTGEDLNTLYIY